MRTKNIFKAVALAMMMPAMLLTTACSSDDDSIINNENINKQNTAKKGYALPVTVNVTRQGDAATRATYTDGGGTGSLAFGAGDKLFVNGSDKSANGAGQFAGELTWQSGGTFSGTIYTKNPYSGTADQLFSAANPIYATLLPYGYESTGFLYFLENYTTEIYDDGLTVSYSKAFVASETAKATGVEQLSWERASTYSNGFALAPLCAVLNFTISGLEAGDPQNVTLWINDGQDYPVAGSVTPNALGVATFAVGVKGGSTISNRENNLTVGSSNFTLPSSTTFAAGKIYNITRNVALTNVTASDIGKLIGSDGSIYSTQAAATAANTTAVAMIAYVGNESNCSHGLAIALENVGNGNTWDSAAGLCNAWNESTSPKKVTGGTWRLPTIIDWQYMFIGCGASGSVEDNPTVGYSMSYSGLATKLNAALPASLWSTDGGDTNHWYISFNSDNTATFRKSTNSAGKTPVRACLVF